MEHLSNDYKDYLNQHKNSHKLSNEMGHPLVNLMGLSMEPETTSWSESPNRGKVIVEQILVSEERNKFKRAGL